jgi:hypothetical protein
VPICSINANAANATTIAAIRTPNGRAETPKRDGSSAAARPISIIIGPRNTTAASQPTRPAWKCRTSGHPITITGTSSARSEPGATGFADAAAPSAGSISKPPLGTHERIATAASPTSAARPARPRLLHIESARLCGSRTSSGAVGSLNSV